MNTRWRVIGAVTVVACLAFVAVAWRASQGVAQGPFLVDHPSTSVPLIDGVNKPFAFGEVYLFNGGDLPATVDSAHILAASPTMKQVAVYARRVTDKGPVPDGFYQNWPRSYRHLDLRPVSDVPVLPDPKHGRRRSFVDILFKLVLTKPGRGVFHGVEVLYHVGSHHYRIVYPCALAACYPHPHDRCTPPADME